MSDNSTTVNFNLRTAGFVNYANQTLTFRLLTAGATGSNDFVVLPSVVTATSDANGDGSVVLFRNGVSDIASVHEVIFPNREKAQFIIPSGTSTVELSNLLVNSQPTGSTVQQSSVYAQAIQRANHTGTQLLNTISNAGTIASQDSDAVNIDGGAIDATVIGANSAAAGTFAALTSTSISVSDGNITNAGDINCDSISSDVAATGLNIIFDGTDTGDNKISLTDNLANALDITESANSYLKFTTTNSGEKVVISKDLDISGTTTAAAGTFTSISASDGNITNVGDINCDSISADDAATGLNVIFDGTDTGDNKITLTDNLASALDITESTNSYLKFTTTDSGEKVVIGKDLDISGTTTAAAVTGTNVLASAQSGYNTGGTITQGTSITTAVSLDQPSGVITLFANDFGANSTTSFTLNNNFIDINDVVVASFKTGHSQLTLTVTATANNSCTFTLYNPTGSGTGSITAVINFAIIKTSTT